MRHAWIRDELLLVLRLYCRTPFGRLHKNNPEIIKLANLIGRTPSAVAMKAVNFANLDPNLDRRGLSSVSKADRALWDDFLNDSQSVALEAESLFEESRPYKNTIKVQSPPLGPTEAVQAVKVRRVQRFFRDSVLASYESKCAISGLNLPNLLIASHIIPWKDDSKRRADPTNGILLNSLYDRAFDKGYMTFDEDWRVCLADDLKQHFNDGVLCERLLNVEGGYLQMPTRFSPDPLAMEYHRNNVFEKAYL